MCAPSGRGEDVAALVFTECKEQSRRIGSLWGGHARKVGEEPELSSSQTRVSGSCEESSQTGVPGSPSPTNRAFARLMAAPLRAASRRARDVSG